MSDPIALPDPEAIESTETDPVETDAKTYTQDEINDIVTKRLAREKAKFADYEELKKFKRDQDKARKAALSDQERALEQAREEGFLSAKREYSESLAAAEIKAALAGIVEDPDEIIDDLKLSKYVGDDGSIDREAVESLRAKYQNLLGKKAPAPAPKVGHGRRTKSSSNTPMDDFSRMFEQLTSG